MTAAEGALDAIVIHADDDVAVALRDLASGARARLRIAGATREIDVGGAIPLGHKFALHALAPGAIVRKYGEAIGVATAPIAAGAHVHVHNMASRRARKAP